MNAQQLSLSGRSLRGVLSTLIAKVATLACTVGVSKSVTVFAKDCQTSLGQIKQTKPKPTDGFPAILAKQNIIS